ncbi:MAG: DUF1211 domain-containing protein [Bacteroidetes bacterium]|nr:DUF1211 domain-containing protein [Bacteroidota bacterium]
MNKTRLEAFSDGVIAIIITIMVLEFKMPHSAEWSDLRPLIPTFISYVLSFIYIGIYWNNHHHMVHTIKHIGPGIMWTNLNLLFWLSLVPFATAWMGENHFAGAPVAVYAIILIMCGISYDIMRRFIIYCHPHDAEVRFLLSRQQGKTIASTFCYAVAIAFSFFYPYVSLFLFFLVGTFWFIPDKNIQQNADKKS